MVKEEEAKKRRRRKRSDRDVPDLRYCVKGRSLFSLVVALGDVRARPSTRAGYGENKRSKTRGDRPRRVAGATTTTGERTVTTSTATTGMPMTAASSSRGDACQEDRQPRAVVVVDGEADARVRFRAGNLRRRRRRLPRQTCEGGDGAGEVAHPSECSALSYVLARQIDDKIDYCRSLTNARFANAENLYRKDLLSHYGCVNAIEFSNQGDLLVSGESDCRLDFPRRFSLDFLARGKERITITRAFVPFDRPL